LSILIIGGGLSRKNRSAPRIEGTHGALFALQFPNSFSFPHPLQSRRTE
jgi:hypothetical protein